MRQLIWIGGSIIFSDISLICKPSRWPASWAPPLQTWDIPSNMKPKANLTCISLMGDFSDSFPWNYCMDYGVPNCYYCYDSAVGADDRCGESVLLKGLSETAELDLWFWSVYCLWGFKLCSTFSKLRTLLLSKRKQPDLSLCPVWLASPKSSAGARVIGAASRAPIQDGAVVGTLAKKNFAAPPKHPILEDLWRSSSTACVYLFLSVFGKSFNKFMCILFRLFHFVLEVSNPFACHLHYIMKSVVICTYYREQQKHRCFKASCTVN